MGFLECVHYQCLQITMEDIIIYYFLIHETTWFLSLNFRSQVWSTEGYESAVHL